MSENWRVVEGGEENWRVEKSGGGWMRVDESGGEWRRIDEDGKGVYRGGYMRMDKMCKEEGV